MAAKQSPAAPQPVPAQQQVRTQSPLPRTVLATKVVDLALVTYMDERNIQRTQLAIVGDNHVHLLDPRPMGFGKEPLPQGIAANWIRDGVLRMLGRKE
jgi:hypothetical protein